MNIFKRDLALLGALLVEIVKGVMMIVIIVMIYSFQKARVSPPLSNSLFTPVF